MLTTSSSCPAWRSMDSLAVAKAQGRVIYHGGGGARDDDASSLASSRN